MRSQSSHNRGGSVSQDRRKALSAEKCEAYIDYLQNLESNYTMFSVSLDEALGMQKAGRREHALLLLSLAPALCSRLSLPLRCLLGSRERHARHFGITPNILPLNPENFQPARGEIQRTVQPGAAD